MLAHGKASLQLFSVVWIFLRSLRVICYDRRVLSAGHKNYLKDWCLMISLPTFLFLTPWIMGILSKGCKPDIRSHNSLKLSFTNIRGLCSNFVDCESFLESNSPGILALCETHLDESIDSGNFTVRVYVPLIRKDSATHMHGLAVYVKEGLPSARDLFLENFADSYLCFPLSLLIDLVNSVIIFLSHTTLLRWLTFLLRSQTVIIMVLLFWIYLFLLALLFDAKLSLHWDILIMWLSQFLLTFHQIYNGMPRFIT